MILVEMAQCNLLKNILKYVIKSNIVYEQYCARWKKNQLSYP